MDKSSRWYRCVFEALERSWVFNLNQIILDPGKRRHIERFLRDVDYKSMVDIGCGTGNWSWLDRGRYLGVDTSPAFIEACRKRYPNQPTKEFVQADAATLTFKERYDLSILISVLHHLSDSEVRRLVDWVARSTRYFFILDLYPIPWNPLSRFFYSLDRGNHIREPAAQKALILANPAMRVVKEDSYFCPNGMYRHTLFLFESTAGSAQGN